MMISKIKNIHPYLYAGLNRSIQESKDPEFIIDTICKRANLTKDEVLSSNRAEYVAYTRMIIMFLLKVNCGLTQNVIGKMVQGEGYKNHTSAGYAIKSVKLRKFNYKLAQYFDKLLDYEAEYYNRNHNHNG
jgi:chromosomal replication initiation ATPase DnaA